FILCCSLRTCLPRVTTIFPYTTLCLSRRRYRSYSRSPRPAVARELDVDTPAPNRAVRRNPPTKSPHAVSPPPSHDPFAPPAKRGDRKSTRLNSSYVAISYAVFFLKYIN